MAAAFLHERDLYLSWSLRRSKAVNGSRCVVGVVGRGHLRGIAFHLLQGGSESLRFRDLAGLDDRVRPSKPLWRSFTEFAAVNAALVIALQMMWGAWAQRPG